MALRSGTRPGAEDLGGARSPTPDAPPATPSGLPFEPPSDVRVAMAERVVAILDEFVEALPDAPASNHDGALEVAARLREPAPERGTRDLEAVLAQVREAARYGFEAAGPGYLAYIPGGGLWTAALGDLLATVFNRFVNLWYAAPPFAQIEATLIRWFADLFDLPETAGGILTSGGSMANFSAIVAARRSRLGDDLMRGALYASDQTHASVAKAAVLAGFAPANVRAVPTDANLHLEVDALAEAVRRDRDAGLRPFLVIANAGTTNTGAVDPIADVARVAQGEGLWLHVDAAYGGFFQLTERGRAAFRGIERADSITLDPHKGMFLPYGTGCLLVRDRAELRRAHQIGADYLQDLAAEDEIPNFSDHSPELSRDFRGLRVWLPLKLHGFEAFRDALDEKLDLARYLDGELRAIPGLEVPWPPELTVVPFRYAAAEDATGENVDALNRRLLERINGARRVMLSSTLVRGRFTLRACILSHRTRAERVEEAVAIIRDAVRELTE